MRKPGTDETNVQMSDVICDYCHREWTEDLPLIEGHHGSCVCGYCLTIAYRQVVLNNVNAAPPDYSCTMCLEGEPDRAALNRGREPGWQSPAYPGAVICRRCIKLAAGALHKDKDVDWRKPE